MYRALDLSRSRVGNVPPVDGPTLNNFNVVCTATVPVMNCPSSPFPVKMSYSGWGAYEVPFQCPTYVGISGAIDHPSARPAYNNNGQWWMVSAGRRASGGLLVALQSVRFLQVSDGLSNTLLVAEQSGHVAVRATLGGWVIGPMAWWLTYDDRVWNLTTVLHPINQRDPNAIGNTWGGGNTSINSAHPGGANAVFGDGSVRFLRESLELQTLYNLANRDDGRVIGEF